MKGYSESEKTIPAKGMLIPLLQMWTLPNTVTLHEYEGVSNHSPLPKYANTWDMNKLLTYYDNMGPNSELTWQFYLYFQEQGALREKCPSTEFFLVLIFPHSD